MKYFKSRFHRFKKTLEIKSSLVSLTSHEKAILREFYLLDKSTLNLPCINEDVVSLESKSIIYKCSDLGSVTYNHQILYPYRISEYALKKISHTQIGLLNNPSMEQIEDLKRRRPTFIKHIPQL